MAQIIEEVLIIKVSRLAKNGVDVTSCITEETRIAIEQVAQELLGSDVVVEAEKA